MTTEKMTVHKALCELKTLDSRIQKAIGESVFVFANKHSNNKVSGMGIGEYSAEIKAKYQSVCDLLARRDAIKRAVTLSNASVKVTIGGKEYTVAEAIEMKNHGIPLEQMLLKKLDGDNKKARRLSDENNGEILEMRADEYVKSLYGNVDMKGASEEIKKVRADLISAQTMEIVDPIGISSEMERLDEEISTFVAEIDSALSVSNALTELEISY